MVDTYRIEIEPLKPVLRPLSGVEYRGIVSV